MKLGFTVWLTMSLVVGGRLFRLRGSEERVSLAAIGVYPLDQGAVVSRSAANGLSSEPYCFRL